MTEKKLIYNALRTPDGTMLVSKHRHDYRTYKDKNGEEYMVDGGLDYARRSCSGEQVDMCKYDDEPHEVQRDCLTWGNRGKHGDQPLTFLRISEMETTHIEAVLKECSVRDVIKKCMEEELKRRLG